MKYKLIELQGKIDSYTIIAGDFNNPLSIKDRTTRWTISKDTEYLHNTIKQRDLTGIHRSCYPTKYIFSSRAPGTFSMVDHTLGHKLGFNRFIYLYIYRYLKQSIILDCNRIEERMENLEICGNKQHTDKQWVKKNHK